jgi:hypothetical protein
MVCLTLGHAACIVPKCSVVVRKPLVAVNVVVAIGALRVDREVFQRCCLESSVEYSGLDRESIFR